MCGGPFYKMKNQLCNMYTFWRLLECPSVDLNLNGNKRSWFILMKLAMMYWTTGHQESCSHKYTMHFYDDCSGDFVLKSYLEGQTSVRISYWLSMYLQKKYSFKLRAIQICCFYHDNIHEYSHRILAKHGKIPLPKSKISSF